MALETIREAAESRGGGLDAYVCSKSKVPCFVAEACRCRLHLAPEICNTSQGLAGIYRDGNRYYIPKYPWVL